MTEYMVFPFLPEESWLHHCSSFSGSVLVTLAESVAADMIHIKDHKDFIF